ncbi:MAG: hypothetical protein ACHQUC_00810 [Chlamydiales bacterium]
MNLISTFGNGIEKGLCYFVENLDTNLLSNLSTIFETGVIHSECTKTSVAKHHQKIQLVFNAVNFTWCCREVFLIATLLAENYTLSTLLVPALSLTALAIGTIGAIILLGKYLVPTNPTSETILNQSEIPEDQRESIKVQFESPFAQKIAQTLYVARMVANVALIYLSPQHLLNFAINLCGSAYNLLKISQLKWLRFDKVFDITDPDSPFAKLSFTYFSLLMKGDQEKCQICLDEGNILFDDHHAIDFKCLTRLLHETCTKLLNALKCQPIDHYSKYGVFDGRSYHISLPYNNIVTCPTCRLTPRQIMLLATVEDRVHGNCKATINIKDEPYTPSWLAAQFFERMNTIYTAFQAALSRLQVSHYELIHKLRQMQKALLVVDLAALVQDAVALYEQIRAKYRIAANDELIRKMNWRFVIGSVVVAVAAVGAMFALNYFNAPAIDPKELFVKIFSLSTLNASKIAASWNNDWMNKIWQTTLIARIAVNLISTIFSKNRYSKLANAGLLALTLFNTSQLPWLSFDFAVDQVPFQIAHFKTTSYYILPPIPKDSDLLTHLKTGFQQIYHYTSSLFKGSNWSSYWHRTETSHNLNYDVTVAPKRILNPYLDNISGTAFDIIHRVTAKINVFFT